MRENMGIGDTTAGGVGLATQAAIAGAEVHVIRKAAGQGSRKRRRRKARRPSYA